MCKTVILLVLYRIYGIAFQYTIIPLPLQKFKICLNALKVLSTGYVSVTEVSRGQRAAKNLCHVQRALRPGERKYEYTVIRNFLQNITHIPYYTVSQFRSFSEFYCTFFNRGKWSESTVDSHTRSV
jgi:hypothetical protein